MPSKRKSTAKPPRLKKQRKTAKAEPTITDNLQQYGRASALAADSCANDALLDISINFTAINKVACHPGRRMALPPPPLEQGNSKLRVTWNREAPREDSRNVEESAELLAKKNATSTRRTQAQRQDAKKDAGNVHRTPAQPRKKDPPKQDIKTIEEGPETTTEEDVEESREGNAEETTEKSFEANTERDTERNIDPLNTEGSIGEKTEGNTGRNHKGSPSENIGWMGDVRIEDNTETLAEIPVARIRKKAPPKQKPQDFQDQAGPKDDVAAIKPAKARPPRKRPPRPPREKWVDPDPYIPRTTISKHAKQPTPVSFPHPSTHALESRPTQNGCLWCRWRHKLKPDVVKVKKSTVGCKECNIPLCRECFISFHATG